MSQKVQIKVHNIFHQKSDYDLEQAESYIENWIVNWDITNVRIAPGPKNSPLFITVSTNSLSMKNAKKIARSAVTAFSEFVNDVDIDSTIKDKNLHVKAV